MIGHKGLILYELHLSSFIIIFRTNSSSDCWTPTVSPALSVSAGSGKLSRDGDTLAAPQASHDGGGGQRCTPGGGTFGLLNEGGGGTSHDAPLSQVEGT